MKQTFFRNLLVILMIAGGAFGLFAWNLSKPVKNDAPAAGRAASESAASEKTLVENFQKIPLYFEPNVGQTAERSSFITRGYGYEMHFSPAKTVLSLARTKNTAGSQTDFDETRDFSRLTMTLAGANKDAVLSGEQEASGKINYLVGSDRDKWLTDIPTYQKIRYKNVYAGVDMVYYGNQSELEFDFAVAPATDPRRIEMNFEGANKIAKNSAGELVISLAAGDVVLRAPVLYQLDDQGKREAVEGEFALVGKYDVGFSIGDYDSSRELIIDPVLSYSTFLPGSNTGYDIAVDNDGNAIITGQGFGVPTTTGATSGGVFVTKFNPQGSSLVFSTRVGGSASSEIGRVVKLDSAGNIVVAGSTSSRDFPLVNPVKARSNLYVSTNSSDTWSNNNNLDDFQVFQIAPSMQDSELVYATASNRVYRSTNGGSSWTNVNNNLPAISSIMSLAVHPNDSAQLLVASQNSLYRSTNGGTSWTLISGATVSGAGISAIVYDPANPQNIYLATGNAVRKSIDGGANWTSVNTGLPAGANITALVINPQNPAVLYAGTGTQGVFKTSDGGANWIAANFGISGNNSNIIRKLAIDPATPSSVYVATGNYAGANYVFKTNNEATTWSLIYTSPAGTNNEIGAIAVSRTNGARLYVGLQRGGLYRSNDGGATWNRTQSGMWSSSISTIVESPLAAGRIYVGTAQDSTAEDAFAFKLNPNGNTLIFSTILGGSDYEYGFGMDVDAQDNVYVAGTTKSLNFPVLNAVQPRPGFEGAGTVVEDGFVTKIASGGSTILYSTYLGGSTYDWVNAVAVAADGSLAITGRTLSNDFPVYQALQPTNRGNDAFVTKLTPSGSAYAFSTFWGTTGEDSGNSLKFDNASNLILVGSTTASGLTTVNAVQPAFAGGSNDGFITKFSSDGGQVLFSTYFGGRDSDRINDVALDASGNIYVTGASSSKDFPQLRSVKSRSPYFRSSNGAVKWTNLNTNIYAEIFDFAFHPTAPGVMFAAASADGLIKSVDGGDTWNKVASAPAALAYGAVEFNPQNPNIVYAAYREATGNNVVRLAVSNDGGASWTPFNAFIAGSDPIYKIVVAPTNPQIIYVATFFSIYKTVDGGANWQRATTGDMWPIQDFTVNPADPSILYVAQQYSGGGIHRSLNGGANWQRMTNGITGQYAEFVVVDPQQPATVYARTSGGIFKSLNNGDDWTLMQTPNVGFRITVDPHSSQTLYLPSHPTASAPFSGVYKSLDGGATWSLFNEGMPVSSDFAYLEADPYVPGALHGTVRTDSPSNDDVFVSKLNPAGTSLLYSSVIGGDIHMGNAFQDVAFGVAVSPQGSAFVTGGTSTSDFPTTPGAYNRTLNNQTLFVARFDASWNVKGRLTEEQTGNPIHGVKLTLGGAQTLTSDSDGFGRFVFPNVIEHDDFDLVPRKLGWDFTPQSYSVADLNEDKTLNFTGVYTTYTIEGRIEFGQTPLANVAVNLTGSQSGSTVTDGSGNFSFTVPKYGDYTVVPALDGYIFAPPRLTFNNVTSNLRADFTARQGYAISGQILRNGNPVAGVPLRLSGSENQTTATDSSGRYSFDAGLNGDYLVTPVSETLTFAPIDRTFANLTSNQTGDFVASRIPYVVDYLTYSGEYSFTQSQNEIFNIDDEGFNQQRLTDSSVSESQPSWSPNGRKITYLVNSQLWIADYNGANARVLLNNGSVVSSDWSPDGKKIVLSSYLGGNTNIYVINADGTNLRPLTNDSVGNYSPKWSPDGTKILFSRAGKLYTMTTEGTNLQRVTTSNPFLSEDYPDWSPDGSEIVFMLYNGSEPRIYLVRADGTNLRRLTSDNDREFSPSWSLRGSRIAYIKGGDSGNIFIVNADGTGSKQITNNNLRKSSPVWKPRLTTAPLPDFDDDGRTDISVFRPSAGEWWINRSSTSQTAAVQFGISTDLITSADFTGDGATDVALFRPSSGEWFILRSEDSSYYSVPFGQAGDIPAVGDFDGDLKADIAVFRPSSGTWFVSKTTGGTMILNFGQSGDKPVVADYDGDARADVGIFRPEDGSWWYLQSSTAQFKVYRFGLGTDLPVPGDYTGDGKADIAVYRPSTGEWFFQRSEDNSYYSVPFGQAGDIPAPGDYDGDGKKDTAVFRPETATWYINQTSSGVKIVTFGLTGDRPIPAAQIP